MKNMETKKHILIITYNDYPVYEGLGVRIKNLSQIFLENGYEVTIFAPNIDNRRPKQEQQMGCQIIRTNIYMPGFLKKKRTLARAWSMIVHTVLTPFVYFKYLRKKAITLIQAEQVYSIPPAIMVRIFKRTKIIVDDIGTVSDMLREAGSRSIAKIFTVFEKLIFKFCYKFIYTSSISALYYKKRGAEPSFFVPNGVNCNEFRPANTNNDKVVIFFNGSTYSQQNCAAVANFIEVGKKTMENVEVNIEFRLICWPEYNLPSSVRQDIRNEKNWLHYREGVEDIAAEIVQADILLLPYSQGHHLTGGVRLKSLEYMACGKVVISTSEGVEGITGLVPNEHFLLAESLNEIPQIISTIIRSPDKMKKIGENARAFILNNYDWRQTSAELIKAYNSI